MESDKWTALQMLSEQISQIVKQRPMDDFRLELEIERRSVEFRHILNEGIQEAKMFLKEKMAESQARNEASRKELQRFISMLRVEEKSNAVSQKKSDMNEDSLSIKNKSKKGVMIDKVLEKLRIEKKKALKRLEEVHQIMLEKEELKISLRDAHQEICALWARKEKDAAKARSVIENLKKKVSRDQKEIQELEKSESEMRALVAGMRERCQDHAQIKLKNIYLSELLALSQQAVDKEVDRAEFERGRGQQLQDQINQKDVQISNLYSTVAVLAEALRQVEINKRLNIPFTVPPEWKNWLDNFQAAMNSFSFAGTTPFVANTSVSSLQLGMNMDNQQCYQTPTVLDRSGVNRIFDQEAESFSIMTSPIQARRNEYLSAEDVEVEQTLSWRPLVPMAVILAEANTSALSAAEQVPEPVYLTDQTNGGLPKPKAVPMMDWLRHTNRY